MSNNGTILCYFQRQIINNENTRRHERITNAKNNDIWEYRTSPPEDWAAPLKNAKPPQFPSQTNPSSGSGCVVS